MSETREFDIVVFGATGFTGGLVAEYLAAQSGALRWALAGRNVQKLEAVKARLRTANPPAIVVADAADRPALDALAKRARVVLTTVGPYVRYGEPLVAACAAHGTHYVDLTGEPPFVADMRARYDATARASGAKIVHCCGFDSIPHDLGAYYTVKALRARLPEATRDTTAIRVTGIVRAGGTFSGGTWHSALEIMGGMGRHKPARTPKSESTRKVGALPQTLHFVKELGLWLLPMPTIDPVIVLTSARSLSEYGPDFRYGHFVGLRNLSSALGLTVGVGAMFTMAQLKPTRSLLERFRTPGEGPDEATRNKSWFRVTFLGEAGGVRVRSEVRGGDPGYGETSKMIAESALALAFDALPAASGVLTTAVAMGDALIARLERAGIGFAVLS
jgi:short subunit dehydrogenase-like uncharacterized protein